MAKFGGLLIVLLVSTLAMASVNADDKQIHQKDADAIRQVIEGQIAALQRDDWPRAFSYAAPNIQEKFGSPEGFRRMVLNSYTIVHRPTAVSFEDLEEVSGRLAQKVFMVGSDGLAAIVVYFMDKLDDGVWRIVGVSIHPVADQSA